ncbi:MAG: beta strand repeat-containing protein, partial [Gammaproteobacteria bacterium]
MLDGTTSVAAVAGIANFPGINIDEAGVGYTLMASAAGLTGATSAAFTVSAGAATQLAFTVQPSAEAAGAVVTPAVQVTARDAFGNSAPTFTGTVTLAIGTNPPGTGVLDGTTSVAAVAGVATFAALDIDEAGVGYTLTANAAGVSGATSAAFTITPGPATLLAFTVQPSNEVAGAAITPAVQVTARDALGNTATGFTGTVTIAIGTNPPGTGVLDGTTSVAAAAGVASFPGVNIDETGAGYTLTAGATGPTGATSNAFTISAGAATQLAFTVQPGNTAAGAALTPAVQVTARDALGNTATGFTGTVTLAIGTNPPPGGVLDGTTSVAAVAAVASFPGLDIDEAGAGYTLTATAAGLSGATSSAFTVTPGVATQLAFTVQPSNTAAGATITPAVQVTARDALGNTATAFTGTVTLAIGVNPPGTGVLDGTTAVAAVVGVATFPGINIDEAGVGYTLTAGATGLTGATSAAFTITPGAATQLAFTTQPTTVNAGAAISPAVAITARDQFNNTATGFTGPVTIAIGTNGGGTGVLAGTLTVNAVAGVATFPDLSLDKVGTGYTLTAASGALTGATSAAFNVTPGTATRVVFTQEPTNVVAGVVFSTT